MKRTGMKKALRAIVFFALLAALMIPLSKVMTSTEDYRNYQWVHGFFEEREDSLDAVYLGSSATYAFWMAPLAWENYGITVYPLASNSQPLAAAEGIIREARKTQPNALYIVKIGLQGTEYSEPQLHYLLDYFPNSINKLKMTNALLDLSGYEGKDRLEFYFPLYRYHSRWEELTEADFNYELDGLKGGSTYSSFLRKSVDVSAKYRQTDRREPLPEDNFGYLDSLLDYCDEEDVDVLFVNSPQITTDESALAQINSICDYLEARGYPALNMNELYEEIGLDLAADYYSTGHTNCHGAAKVTDYLSRYLMEHYGFEDKRGDPAYADWDQAFEKYNEIISEWGCDFEWDGSPRDNTLAAPELSGLEVNGQTLTLSWKASKGADGYCIYRKDDAEAKMFAQVADVDGKTLFYADEGLAIGTAYTYVVAPYRETDGVRYWGKYNFAGLSETALIAAPQNLTVSDTADGVTLTWDPVPGADGYWLNRRVYARSWQNQGEPGPDTSYVDTAMLEGLPYQYRVRAYWINEAGEYVYGSWSGRILYIPEFSGPSVTVELENGAPVLIWGKIETMAGYTVARREPGGEWTVVADLTGEDNTQFRDITAQAGTEYKYQVSANFVYSNGTKTKTYPSEVVTATAEAEPIQLEPPEILMAEQVGNVVQLVWGPSANATSYHIYRQAEGESEWILIKAFQTGNTYQDKPPAEGTYTYTLQPMCTQGGCTYYGQFREDAGQTAVYGAG